MAEVLVSDVPLRTLLLCAFELTGFDLTFTRKRKHTTRTGENLVYATLRALKSPLYDADPVRNMRSLKGRLEKVNRDAVLRPTGPLPEPFVSYRSPCESRLEDPERLLA